MMDASVVIVAKRGEKEVYDCINSIKKQSIKLKEIIIVSQEAIKSKGTKNMIELLKQYNINFEIYE